MSSATINLNGVERASLLLFALGQQRASEVLKHLDLRDVELIGSNMASMKNISLDTVDGVLGLFIAAFDKQSALGGDSEEYIRNMLANALGAEKAEVMIDRVLISGGNQGIHQLQWMDARTIADWVRSEHPQIVANLLSLLDGQRAADVIMILPEAMRPGLLMRIAALEGLSSAALRELDEVIAEQWACNENGKSSVVRGVNVAANILNRLDNHVSSQMLDEIADSNAELARKIQDKMFVFEEIANLDDRGMQTLLREVATDRLLLALRSVSEGLKNKIFGNMSRRTAEMLRDDLASASPAKPSEIEAAQKEILMIVRSLADSGAVEFGSGDDHNN
ncbi:flagellar motor switch protein FliG [Methylomicrobium sp. Wu6]|uniref:flagellar motor switch protein FliG n=1 Tax=Methylomicrobium sp. Wu6 TaxID=3107928 RepID=UPI002DD65DE8|nr:flagellar motor switch protein FliG [Methylomicrobium sp. Wu6]MEC4747972.1 flagellar motor switch protein FliG [Methylomicrobium sp. Wu6]